MDWNLYGEPATYNENGITEWSNEHVTNTQSVKVFPTPTRNQAIVKFELQKNDHVILSIYNSNGQRIEHLFSGEMNPDIQQLEIDCSDLSTGIYIIKLQTGKEIVSQKLIVN